MKTEIDQEELKFRESQTQIETDARETAPEDVQAGTETEQEEAKMPWYKKPGAGARIVVIIIAAGLICKGIIELLQK